MKKVAFGALQSPPPPSRPTQGLVCPWDSPSALGRALNFGHLNLGAGGVYALICIADMDHVHTGLVYWPFLVVTVWERSACS